MKSALIVSLLCLAGSGFCDQPLPYHVTYLETSRIYYREPAYTIRNVVDGRALVSMNGSEKWAAYDGSSKSAYNDVRSTVTILRDVQSGNRAVLSSMIEEIDSPLGGRRDVEKTAGIFYVGGIGHTLEKTTKQGKDFIYETSSTVSSFTEKDFNPAQALEVPAGEPTRVLDGVPVFEVDYRTIYTTPDRKYITKIVSESSDERSTELTFSNFVAVGDTHLPTEIKLVRLADGVPHSSKRQSEIKYSLERPVTIESLFAQAKGDKSFDWVTAMIVK